MKKLLTLLVAMLMATPAFAAETATVQNFSLSLANSESLNTTTDATFTLVRNNSGVVTLTCNDDDITCAFTIKPGGAAALLLGSSSVSAWSAVNDGSDFVFTRGTSGTVTITAADNDSTAALTIKPGGAAAFGLGGSSTTAITLLTDSTGTGEVVMPTDAVDATEITDITRSVQLPIAAWAPCAGTVAGIWDSSGTDTEPDLAVYNSGGLAIIYDVTGGSVDVDTICISFVVPDDYVSGGAFVMRGIGGTTTATERFGCDVAVDGAALVGINNASLASSAAVQSVTSTPVATYAAGSSVAAVCAINSATASDDAVNILGVRWTYTATE